MKGVSTVGSYIFRGGRFLNPRISELTDGIELLVEGGLVKEVSDVPIRSGEAEVVELGGRTLMPGLIDAHVHMYYFLSKSGPFHMRSVPQTFSAAMATSTLKAMLMRGFTSVRDMGGGDYGMRDASEAGFVDTPRLYLSGRSLSQTSGHGDFRDKMDMRENLDLCCTSLDLFTVVADGVDEVIKAVRNELRKGADHIKIHLSGGVASPNDPLDSVQYRTDEIAAAVEEASRWGKYVAAHAYSNAAIKRGVAEGVRTVEHGNLIEEDGVALMREKGAFLVPTLITYDLNERLGTDSGKSEYMLQKNKAVYDAGLRSLELCSRAGVEIGFGTDLMTFTQKHQCEGLQVQGRVLSAADVIHSATIVNARIMRQEGLIGELVAGSHADLLVVEGDPLSDLSVFQDGGPNLAAIMKAGRFYKNLLG